MATYTKETALYDTGKIGNDIAAAGQTATSYLTTISGTTGISVHDANDEDNFVNMNSEGVNVYQGGTNVASFGSTTRIGTDGNASIAITDSSIVGTGEDQKKFFNFANSDATVSTGYTYTKHIRMRDMPTSGSNAITLANVNYDPSTIRVKCKPPTYQYNAEIGPFSFGTSATKTLKVTINNIEYTFSVSYNGARILKVWVNKSNSIADYVSFTAFLTKESIAPSYEIGDGIASGGYALTEGYETTASGNYSHAEGQKTSATGLRAHTEGYSTVASGANSHSEGSNSEASGNFSHAQNYYTIASGESQTAIGKYNVSDTTSAFIIGNGYLNTAGPTEVRSNALTVDWNGNVNIASGASYKINGTALTASNVGAVPTTRKVNSKALSSDISLTASDVGAVPTTRKVNSKALSSDISLTASDVSAVPTTRTVNSKALSSDISLTAEDVSAVPTTRTINSKALSSDISLTAADVSAVPTTRTVNGKALSANVADADYITSTGAESGFYWRKWNSETVEAWGIKSFNATAGTAWGNMYYYDFSITIPSGIFSASPLRGIASCNNLQWIVAGISIISATSVKVRLVKPVSSSQAGGVYIYLYG